MFHDNFYQLGVYSKPKLKLGVVTMRD